METGLRPVSSTKIKYIDTDRRMSYKDYFEYANANLQDKVCVLINSDIVLTEDIAKLNKVHMKNAFICLSRWNESGETREGGGDSQDTWVFKSPVDEGLVKMADYNMGTQFCDSVLSYLACLNGYMLFNPSEEIVTRHIHSSKFRSEETGSTKALQVTDGLYMIVHPSYLLGEVKIEVLQCKRSLYEGKENELERIA